MSDVTLSLKGVHGPYLVALVRPTDGTGPGHMMALDPLGRAMAGGEPVWTDLWGIPRELTASIPRGAVRIAADGSLRVRTALPSGRPSSAAEVAYAAGNPSDEPLQEAVLSGICAAPGKHGDATVLGSTDEAGFTAWALRNGGRILFEGEGACAIHSPEWIAARSGEPVVTFRSRTPDDTDIADSGGLAGIAQQAQSTAGGIALRKCAPQLARAIAQGGDTVLAWRGEGFVRIASPTLSASALRDLGPYVPSSVGASGLPYGVSLLQLLGCDSGEPGRPPLHLRFGPEARPNRSLESIGADGSEIAYAIATAAVPEDERQDAMNGVLRLMGADAHG